MMTTTCWKRASRRERAQRRYEPSGAWQRADARGGDGGVREKLAAGVNGDGLREHAKMTEPSASAREGRLKRASDELSALRLQLVQLIIQQGNIFSNWVKFAITVQGGLAAGLVAVFVSGLAKYRLLGLIIAFFGIATAALFAKILVRHVQWAHWYISRGKELAS